MLSSKTQNQHFLTKYKVDREFEHAIIEAIFGHKKSARHFFTDVLLVFQYVNVASLRNCLSLN